MRACFAPGTRAIKYSSILCNLMSVLSRQNGCVLTSRIALVRIKWQKSKETLMKFYRFILRSHLILSSPSCLRQDLASPGMASAKSVQVSCRTIRSLQRCETSRTKRTTEISAMQFIASQKTLVEMTSLRPEIAVSGRTTSGILPNNHTFVEALS